MIWIPTIPICPRGSEKIGKSGCGGAGPAGLSAAYFLALKGYPVTIFEALPVAGGMMAVGIPQYRLPRRSYRAKSMHSPFGRGIEAEFAGDRCGSLESSGLSGRLPGHGAHKGLKLGIPGERLRGVLDGVSFLRHVNLGQAVKVGSGWPSSAAGTWPSMRRGALSASGQRGPDLLPQVARGHAATAWRSPKRRRRESRSTPSSLLPKCGAATAASKDGMPPHGPE